MKNKNLALVAVLFTISVIMAFANGPTPQVAIDTDQIIDGAVTILKTDGVAANDLSNVTPATGRAALGLGTMAVATATDYVATSALALRLDTTNASISGDIDVTGDVGAATLGITGHSTLTTASATRVQANEIAVNGAPSGPLFVAGDNAANFQLKNLTGTITGGEYIKLTLNSTSNAGHNFESAALRAISTNGGSNLGILAIDTSGAEAMRITSAGNVLIGTTTDDGANKLQVNGSAGLAAIATPSAPVAGTIFYSSADNSFYGYNGTAWKKLDN